MDIWKMARSNDGIEELKKNLLGLDSTFQFKCRKCGKCCKNQDTILFSALDVFRIAKKLGIAPDTVIKRYTEVYIGSQSRIPLVHLLMQGKKNACPFLTEEGRCSIHDTKPTVCRLYPLGRVIIGKTQIEMLDSDPGGIVQYILSGHCGSAKKTHTVREWLDAFDIPENDEFFYLWTGTQLKLGRIIRALEEKGITHAALNPIWNAIFTKLYTDYDTAQEFMPQFQRNADKLLHDISELQGKLKTVLREDNH